MCTQRRARRARSLRSASQLGFTLIELLVVMAIIGILAVIAVPAFRSYRARGFDARSLRDLKAAAIAEEAYFAAYERYTDCIGNCNSVLPGFQASSGVQVDMYRQPVSGTNPIEGFTGRAYHPKGNRKDTLTQWSYNSSQGGIL